MKASKRCFCLFLSVCLTVAAVVGGMLDAVAAESPIIIDLGAVADSIIISDTTIEYNNGTEVTAPWTAGQELELTGSYVGTATGSVIQTTGTTLPDIKLNHVTIGQSLISTAIPVTLNLTGENTVSGAIKTGQLTINGPGTLLVSNDQAAAIVVSDSITLQQNAALTAENKAAAAKNSPAYAIEIMGGAGLLYCGSTATLSATGAVWDESSSQSVAVYGQSAIRGVVSPFDEEGADDASNPPSGPSDAVSPDVTAEGDAYQVELNWGALEFTYRFGDWNTNTLCYENAGWDSSCNGTPADGQLANNEISITNQSKKPVYIYESYSNLEGLPVPTGLDNGVRFSGSNHQSTTDSTANCMVNSSYQGIGQFEIDGMTGTTAESKSTYLLFSKTPDKAVSSISSDFTTVGTITIKISNTPFSAEESGTVPSYTTGETTIAQYQNSLQTSGFTVGAVYDTRTGEVMTDTTGATVVYTDIAPGSVLPKGAVVNLFAKMPESVAG